MVTEIKEKIIKHCDGVFDWREKPIIEFDFEVYFDNGAIATIDFKVNPNIEIMPYLGNRDSPPECGEVDFEIEELRVTRLTSGTGKELINIKNKINDSNYYN